MDDADIVRDELDRYFASNLATTTAAVADEDLPAEVEIALRRAIRAARR